MTEPVVPAMTGTHRFNIAIDAVFTIGRDYVGEALLTLLRESSTIAVDIETFGLGLDSRRLKSVSFGNANRAVVLDPRDPKQAELIKLGMTHATRLVLHNAPYDIPSLYLNGLITLEQIDKVLDTLVYARLANPDELGSKDLLSSGKFYLGLDGEDQLTKAFKMLGYSRAEGFRVFDLDRPVYIQGAAADVVITARLLPVIITAAFNQTTQGHPFYNHGVNGEEAVHLVNREQTINRMLLKRTCKGLPVDLEYLDEYKTETQVIRDQAESELNSLGINPGNGNHLTKWLESNNLIPDNYPRTPKTKAPSATAKHLETIRHPVAQLFVAQKKIVKIQEDYLQKVVDLSINDRIFPVAQVLKAQTGRASMSDPPLHQFSGKARGIIRADPGDTFTSLDWSAIEPVIVSNLAGETSAIEHYESGGDFYSGVATAAGIERKPAKVTLLAALYGEGRVKLAADLGIEEDDAVALQNTIFNSMPAVASLIRTLRQTARDYKMVMSMSGRILPVPEGFYDGRKSVQAHRGVNYVVQGSAYDILAESLIGMHEAGLEDALYLTMHDELIVSTSAAEDVRRIMETPPERMLFMTGRTPKLRTDMAHMGTVWQSV